MTNKITYKFILESMPMFNNDHYLLSVIKQFMPHSSWNESQVLITSISLIEHCNTPQDFLYSIITQFKLNTYAELTYLIGIISYFINFIVDSAMKPDNWKDVSFKFTNNIYPYIRHLTKDDFDEIKNNNI